MRSIEFKEDYYYKESYFKKDTNNICIPNGTSGYKWYSNSGIYEIDIAVWLSKTIKLPKR